MARVLRSMTLTVLSPSPTHASLLFTVTTPSGPEVSLLPVNPTNPPTWNCKVLALAENTSSDLLDRSARRYCSRTGSTQLMSNDRRGLPGIGMVDPVREQYLLARSEEHTSELQSPDHLVCR